MAARPRPMRDRGAAPRSFAVASLTLSVARDGGEGVARILHQTFSLKALLSCRGKLCAWRTILRQTERAVLEELFYNSKFLFHLSFSISTLNIFQPLGASLVWRDRTSCQINSHLLLQIFYHSLSSFFYQKSQIYFLFYFSQFGFRASTPLTRSNSSVIYISSHYGANLPEYTASPGGTVRVVVGGRTLVYHDGSAHFARTQSGIRLSRNPRSPSDRARSARPCHTRSGARCARRPCPRRTAGCPR